MKINYTITDDNGVAFTSCDYNLTGDIGDVDFTDEVIDYLDKNYVLCESCGEWIAFEDMTDREDVICKECFENALSLEQETRDYENSVV